jgi:hypothetical protein
MAELKISGFELLQPHEQRVVEEYKELNDRHTKLTFFTSTHQFHVLQDIDKELLFQQQAIMTKYLAILEQRIARFIN